MVRESHEYRWEGRIFRYAITQPGGAGTPPTRTAANVIPVVYFHRRMRSGDDKKQDGTFVGFRHLELSFQCPGFDVEIFQGDIAEVTYGDMTTRQYIIDEIDEPNDIGGEWRIKCYKDINGGAC